MTYPLTPRPVYAVAAYAWLLKECQQLHQNLSRFCFLITVLDCKRTVEIYGYVIAAISICSLLKYLGLFLLLKQSWFNHTFYMLHTLMFRYLFIGLIFVLSG